MAGRLKQVLLFVSLAIIVLFIIFIINQTVQIVQLAHSLHPVFGEAVKYFLIIIYALLIVFGGADSSPVTFSLS